MTHSKNTKYIHNGIVVEPESITAGERMQVSYNGVLSNADELYAHVGYGDARWNDVSDIKMKSTRNGFEAVLPISKPGKLKVAFKDAANNWDNNAGLNYTFEVHKE